MGSAAERSAPWRLPNGPLQPRYPHWMMHTAKRWTGLALLLALALLGACGRGPEGKYCDPDGEHAPVCGTVSSQRPDSHPDTVGGFELACGCTPCRRSRVGECGRPVQRTLSMRRGADASRWELFEPSSAQAAKPVGRLEQQGAWVTVTFAEDPSEYALRETDRGCGAVFE